MRSVGLIGVAVVVFEGLEEVNGRSAVAMACAGGLLLLSASR